jgi:hypothetical protein
MAKGKSNELNEIATENIKGAKELAREFRYKDIPLYLHSAPGLGKSDIMRQLAAEDDSGFIDVRVGTMLPEDLTGIPVPDMEKGIAKWLRASFWPEEKRDGKRGIIAFDELSDAPRNLQSCIYRVILDRQIGEYKLPRGWWPVAAGNRREDKAAAGQISTALANRFAHIHVHADADCWLEWANTNNISPMLMGFIKWRPGLLHAMDTNGANLLAFPTPRSWAQASKVFDASPGVRHRLMRAIVGEGAAIEVETFFKTVDLPDFNEIVARPKTTKIPQEPASRYALGSLLSRNMDRDNISNIFTYIMRDDFGSDFATVVIMEACTRDEQLCATKTFADWAKKNKSFTL